jgi:hypothetical protein
MNQRSNATPTRPTNVYFEMVLRLHTVPGRSR